MQDKAQAVRDYLESTFKEVEQIEVYFGSHTVKIQATYVEVQHPDLVMCSTINGEEIAIDPSHISAMLAVDLEAREAARGIRK